MEVISSSRTGKPTALGTVMRKPPMSKQDFACRTLSIETDKEWKICTGYAAFRREIFCSETLVGI